MSGGLAQASHADAATSAIERTVRAVKGEDGMRR
jgi:hypothetical protein